MLAARDLESFPFVVIDHKREKDGVGALPAETLNPNSIFLPQRGLHVIKADPKGNDKDDIEAFLERCFERGKIGIYVDEGHLLGFSKTMRAIMIAGRSKRVPVMWISQRAHWIDPFIWSQASFYRAFDLQGPHDIKRFNENFPSKWRKPEEFHSWYYDVGKGRMSYLRPSPVLSDSVTRLENRLTKHYRAV